MKYKSILQKVKPSEIATVNLHYWDSFGFSEAEISARLFVCACQRVGKWAVTKAQLDAEDSSGRYIFNGLDSDKYILKDGEYFVPPPEFVTIVYGKFPAKYNEDIVRKGSKRK